MLQFFDQPDAFSARLSELLSGDPAVFVLTDENVSRHCLPQLMEACPFLSRAEVIEIEPGESSKSLEIVSHIWQHLLECGADRSSVLLNFGGGVVTDLGGFVASTYKRGIRTIHIPTSLLAMTDAAIGGKTGIDFDGIKNSVGTFYQAEVLILPSFIRSLPQSEIISGFGEMLKTALIADAELTSQMTSLKRIDAENLLEFIPTCAFIKQGIVLQDPVEKGQRKLLNLGHTFGHAVESCWMAMSVFRPHGVCVALGILAETRVAVAKQICSREVLEKLEAYILHVFDLKGLELPPFESILEFMLQDKKNASGKIRMVLLRVYGAAEMDIETEPDELKTAWCGLQDKLIG